MFWFYNLNKKFGGLWVAHIQNCHQTQGLLKMDIVVEPQRTENAHCKHSLSHKLKWCFSKKDIVSGRTPCKNIPSKEEIVSQGVFF